MLSIIIPAHDEARLIGDTLAAARATLDALALPHEIIVVADGCGDATAAIARAHGAQVLEVRLRQIAAVRNAGAAIAGGTRLLFVDADTRIDPEVVAAALRALDGGAVGGGARVALYGRIAWHERAFAAVLGWLFRRSGIAPGCFLFCTRAAFQRVGGFDTRYYAGEDVALSRALARLGHFVILRERVHTSDRKLRSHSIGEQLRLFLRFVRHGRRLLHSRDALDFWYLRRDRNDPG